MYRIIGGDQREYGPVSADEIRRWIGEGRLNGRSLVKSESVADWKALSEFPEFAGALRAQAGEEAAGAGAPPPMHPEAWTAEILAREPQLRIGDCLTRSWQLMTKNFGLLLGASALIWLVGSPQFLPVLGRSPIGSLLALVYRVLAGVFFGGLYLVFLKTIRGEKTSIGEAFSGFNIAFGQLLLAGFLGSLLASVGFCFCILPGIYLSVAWVFGVPLVADKRLEFWPAMELSRKVVTKVWFEVLLLIIVAFLPVILAGLFAGAKMIGAMIPAIHQMASGDPQDVGRMMQTMMRFNASMFTVSFSARLVMLINLPFAVGALMYAYENLFGPRTAANA